ncbi:MAG: RagB/SusD family nutrient uptake outer membrane protein [Sphaerochaetaceae bacterium]|nr:RagB/SusD family nutrient uptake outer membrane protein [Sphaerochaetaceae bacterium]MDD4032398.1 RagB/SusD family nutrient uptake outer membrane protein [Bacteroidales bacterium]
MKNLIKIFSIIAFSVFTLQSCIKETFPQDDSATAKQIGESASALDAAMSGIPAQLSQGYLVYGNQTDERDMAYPGILLGFNEALGDIFPQGTNPAYDWYRQFNIQTGLGPNSYPAYLPWRTFYMFIKSANDIISAVKQVAEPSDLQKGYLGMGYAYRAWAYWHMWNMYVPVENQYTTIDAKIKGLTVPLVTDETAETDGKNNPRVSEDVLYDFIMSDLNMAEEFLTTYTPTTKRYPNLAVVYGLKARAFLSRLDYANAAVYARKAIDASGCTPLSQAQWEDPNSGFCQASANDSWMWYISYSAEAMGNLCNWTGWIAGEADWGYNSLTQFGVNRWIYDRIPDSDFRKHSFIDPKYYDYYDYKTCRDKAFIKGLKPYTSIKFRCVGGDWENYATGGASDVPLMRVEEMYLIEAEALGMSSGVNAGVTALTSFMTSYRDPKYICAITAANAFQEEILFQKRVELWGEGLAFFDAKRLRAGSLQSYPGTNAPGDVFKINAVGIKPGWNYVIPNNEVQNNIALEGFINPDPSGTINPTL